MKVVEIEVTPIHPERWGNDLDVVNAARVSFHKESEEFQERDAKLISYLARHKHHSPFNHSFLKFRVKAPIFVARQLVKHKFMPWNEVSRRYVDEEPEFFMPTLRERAENVKQGSSYLVMPSMYHSAGLEHMKNLLAYYENAIAAGMAPEVARAFLPQNMMTEWMWSGTLGAFLDMLVLRLDPHTQYESRIVAHKIAEHVKEVFPYSYAAYLEN